MSRRPRRSRLRAAALLAATAATVAVPLVGPAGSAAALDEDAAVGAPVEASDVAEVVDLASAMLRVENFAGPVRPGGDIAAGQRSGGVGEASRKRTGQGAAEAPSQVGAAPAPRPVTCPATTVQVTSAAQLTAALKAAKPGDVIGLADGTYSGHFVAARPGTSQRPIWLCGGPRAVLDGGDGSRPGCTLHLDGASAWRVVGLSVRGGQKGVMVDRTQGAVLQGLTVSETGHEAIHLRAGSSGNLVIGNTVGRTGRATPKFGEGIYIGTAVKNWCKISACGPDRSDANTVTSNRISGTSSESVDIKEGTTGGRLVGNTFDATGASAVDSAVDVKGNGWTIEANLVVGTPLDAFQVHEIRAGWARGNRFTRNRVNAGTGEVVKLAGAPDNVVACDNTGPAGMKVTRDGCR